MGEHTDHNMNDTLQFECISLSNLYLEVVPMVLICFLVGTTNVILCVFGDIIKFP